MVTAEKGRLIDAIEKAIAEQGKDVKYIVCDDILGFERYEDELADNEYVIQQFGNYYVALIF